MHVIVLQSSASVINIRIWLTGSVKTLWPCFVRKMCMWLLWFYTDVTEIST